MYDIYVLCHSSSAGNSSEDNYVINVYEPEGINWLLTEIPNRGSSNEHWEVRFWCGNN